MYFIVFGTHPAWIEPRGKRNFFIENTNHTHAPEHIAVEPHHPIQHWLFDIVNSISLYDN